jgi:hypothetical protein
MGSETEETVTIHPGNIKETEKMYNRAVLIAKEPTTLNPPD